MDFLPGILGRLVAMLGSLPGIGPKTAQRLAFHLLRRDRGEVEQLSRTLIEARERIHPCSICYALTESDPCPWCRNTRRDDTQLCVVAEARDVFTLERSGIYHGRYHVLQGTLSPLEGVGPDDLTLAALEERVRRGGIQEVILALNPDVEGEATALYIHELLKPLGPKVTRLASGLPAGGDLEYADDVTLSRALAGRREL